MRFTQGHMQESEGIEKRLLDGPKRFEQAFERRIGRATSVGMPAHPIDDGEKCRVIADCNGNTILIVVAIADQT